MAKWVAMWTGSLGAFVVFVIVTQLLLGVDREFQISGDAGFKLLYPTDLPLTGVHFFIDTAKTPILIPITKRIAKPKEKTGLITK